MFQDVVHIILKDYTETKRLFSEKLNRPKNLILLFSIAINECINALTLSTLVRSVIQVVNWYYWAINVILPRGKSKLQSGRWYEC